MTVLTRILLASFLCAFSVVTAARAQTADVPQFDTDGDFLSARVWGNRGYYPHWQWLVIETDPEGLNCRDANGSIVVTLAYGAVVESVFDNTNDAIELVNEQPWLQVRASMFDVRRRVVPETAVAYTCYVRANNEYIAPINPDSQ